MKFIYFLLLLSFESTGQAVDKSDDETVTVFSECAAFFSLMSIAAEKSDQFEMIKTFKQANQLMTFHASKQAGNGRIDDKASNVALTQFSKFLKNMMDEINHNLDNLSILTTKHNDKCNEALKSPKEFAEKVRKTESEIFINRPNKN